MGKKKKHTSDEHELEHQELEPEEHENQNPRTELLEELELDGDKIEIVIRVEAGREPKLAAYRTHVHDTEPRTCRVLHVARPLEDFAAPSSAALFAALSPAEVHEFFRSEERGIVEHVDAFHAAAREELEERARLAGEDA
jgi:hypothetical protein